MTQWANLVPVEYRRRSSANTGVHTNRDADTRSGRQSNEAEPLVQRTEILRSLRPQKLIGESTSMADWGNAYKSPTEIRKLSSAGLRHFYEVQNELIDNYSHVDTLLDSGISLSLIEEYGDDIGTDNPRTRAPRPSAINARADKAAESSGVVQFWINVNLAANVVLLLGKLVVFYLTDSLSIVASLVDSILDMLSTVIIFVSAHFADRRDWKTKHLYPVGRNRLEPIGVLVFSVIMVVSFLKIANESIHVLLSPDEDEKKAVSVGVPSLIIMSFTILVKVLLYILCRNVQSSSVQALAQDAETDVVFNFFSMIFPTVGHLLMIWQLDPLGALGLSIYVVKSWSSTAMEHIDNLTGAAASPQERQQLLYLCMRFSDKIEYITALNAYHAGDNLMCEVDICLDKSLSMRDSHDLAEALQYALETLPIVERAFVHLDYRRDNFTGHMQ